MSIAYDELVPLWDVIISPCSTTAVENVYCIASLIHHLSIRQAQKITLIGMQCYCEN